ncbi:hypothetical protein Tco_0310909 [Tanacetum coccineum]
MADNRTMAQLLEAPTKGYEDAIVIPEITANNFEIKHGLLNISKKRVFWSLNEDILKITILKTNTSYPSRKIRHMESILCEYSGRYQAWSLLQEIPNMPYPILGYAVSNPWIRRIEPTSRPYK